MQKRNISALYDGFAGMRHEVRSIAFSQMSRICTNGTHFSVALYMQTLSSHGQQIIPFNNSDIMAKIDGTLGKRAGLCQSSQSQHGWNICCVQAAHNNPVVKNGLKPCANHLVQWCSKNNLKTSGYPYLIGNHHGEIPVYRQFLFKHGKVIPMLHANKWRNVFSKILYHIIATIQSCIFSSQSLPHWIVQQMFQLHCVFKKFDDSNNC